MARLVLQLNDSPRASATISINEPTTFRADLQAWHRTLSNSIDDRVVIVEHDRDRVPSIARLWAQFPDMHIVDGQVDVTGTASPHTHRFWIATNPTSGVRVVMDDRAEAERFTPGSPPRELDVRAIPLTEAVPLGEPQAEIILVAHEQTLNHDDLSRLVQELEPKRIIIAMPEQLTSTLMRELGYRASGRPWGEAGASALFTHHSVTTMRDKINEAIVRSGRSVERMRNVLPSAEERAAFWRKASHRVRLGRRGDVLDPSFGVPLKPIHQGRVAELLGRIAGPPEVVWDVAIDDPSRISRDAHQCYEEFGVWPMSFSIPTPLIRAPVSNQTRTNLVCPIVPGYPYAFDSVDAYLSTYARSFYAVTHHKAGWDCFRHLEILAAGSAPLMPDIREVPRFSMVHYPKQAMQRILENAQAGGVPSQGTYEALSAFLGSYLSCSAMATYVLRCAGLMHTERILFVDQQHPASVDYLSTLTLIGLKEILGSRCTPMFPVPWIYRDFTGDVSSLYGRGFGTTRVLSPDLRSPAESQHDPLIPPTQEYDAVVVGSIARNFAFAESLLTQFPPERTIWIHGEDSPPLPDAMRAYRRSGTHLFIRSVDAPSTWAD